jgi:hypothetical protein
MPATKRLTKAEQVELDRAIENAEAKYGEFMTAPAFQAYTKISSTTAARWRRGEQRYDTPRAFQRGRRWYYATSEVVAFMRGIQA